MAVQGSARRRFAGWRGWLVLVSIAAVPGPPLVAASWHRAPMRDVRLDAARDITDQVRAGSADVTLPWTVVAGGNGHDVLRVGSGSWQAYALSVSADGGARAIPTDRLDVVGGDAWMDESSRVLLLATADAVVVRWVNLHAPGQSGITAEAIIEADGGLHVQYLHVGARGPRAATSGLLRAGIARAGQGEPTALSVENASSWTLVDDPPPAAMAAGPAPTGCVAPAGTWCDRAGSPCSDRAGRQGNTRCNTRTATRWVFDEGAFCRDCPYTFYIRVECGREMHLPLNDMEGLDLAITNMVTGAPVPLRCVNQTSRALAAGTAPPAMLVTDCDGNGATEAWWAPPLDLTDPGGRVAWGLPGCGSLASEYDTNRNGVIECSELPGGGAGGGELARLSPGEGQIMDCFISDESGTCGLYRVDVLSGGYIWELFANCDGGATEQFSIFASCTEAWAAYEPLPELAVRTFAIAGGCPSPIASIEIVNLGCIDHPGSVDVRLTSDCPVADVLDFVIPGPLAAGAVASVDVQVALSCSPATVTALIDRNNVIAECTESATVAACRAEAGLNALAATACAPGSCPAAIIPDAGPGGTTCGGGTLRLTGTTMSSGCSAIEHRWLDAGTMTELSPFMQSPSFDFTAPLAGGDVDLILESRCADPGLGCAIARDATRVTVTPAPVPAPVVTPTCAPGRADLACGIAGIGDAWWDLDPSLDSDGNGDPADDRDVDGCDAADVALRAPGTNALRVWAVDVAGSCTWFANIVANASGAAPPLPVATAACPATLSTLDCGGLPAGWTARWDADVATDSDGDGDPANDLDAPGCLVRFAYPAGTFTARATVERDPACAASADVTLTIEPDPVPGDVTGLRLARSGAALSLLWDAASGAGSYDVHRGTIGAWYDHGADALGRGGCGVSALSMIDPDDAMRDGSARYYLVSAVGPCGQAVSAAGFGFDGVTRPRIPDGTGCR